MLVIDEMRQRGGMDQPKLSLPLDGTVASRNAQGTGERLYFWACRITKMYNTRLSRVRSVFLYILLLALGTYKSRGQLPGTPLILRFTWRSTTGSGDKFETHFSSEALQHNFDGAIFYLPNASQTGCQLLWRVHNSFDHMDSTSSSEAGYIGEGDLGYPFTSQVMGTAQLIRKYNPSTGDHALAAPGEAISGYYDENFALYGYPRFGLNNEILLSNSGGGVTITSNKNAGGALWEWYWNGKEFINHADYGRLGQTSMFSSLLQNNTRANPTEAGSNVATIAGKGPFAQGSPILDFYNSGTSQVTSSVPLDFNPGVWGGGNENPVIWRDMQMGKTITVNYAGLGAVAHYQTKTYQSFSGGEIIEIPTVYLNGDFVKFYSYDADQNGGAGALVEISLPNANTYQYAYPAHGGVIAATSDGNFAFGIYAVSTSAGGTDSGFTIFNIIDGGATGPDNNSCVKLNAFAFGPFNAGWNGYSSYLISGTLANVAAQMHTLKIRGDL